MKRFTPSHLGRCDFLDVLEEAVVLRIPVVLELSGEERIEDVLVDVTTDGRGETVHLASGRRIRLDGIVALERQPIRDERRD